MPSATYNARVQRTDNATARAITQSQRLVQMELFVRSQLRRGYTDEANCALILADIETMRSEFTALRHELASLRNGD